VKTVPRLSKVEKASQILIVNFALEVSEMSLVYQVPEVPTVSNIPTASDIHRVPEVQSVLGMLALPCVFKVPWNSLWGTQYAYGIMIPIKYCWGTNMLDVPWVTQ